MKNFLKTLCEMRVFLLLWLSQSFSALGSSMTAYALVIWSYRQNGSALDTAFLMVCSYAPYVLCSIFAGTLSDRWDKKKIMLICDSAAAFSTLLVLMLFLTQSLEMWHIYIVNAFSGLMNTVQQPASEVAISRVLPKKYYQKEGSFRYLSSSVNSIFTPVITTAIIGIFGMNTVIMFDLFTFLVAFLILLFFIKIPVNSPDDIQNESFLHSMKSGMNWLKKEPGIFTLIMFLSPINLVASMYEAVFPSMMLSRNGGSEKIMGIVNAVIGISTLLGSIVASVSKTAKSRVKVICNCLLFSMSTENFLLAFGQNVWIWSIAGFLGWITIPLMNTNLSAVMRLKIPESMQGRVYSVRNSLQFFTIPIGYFIGGFAVDCVFEPFMSSQNNSIISTLFGTGKGSGAALFFFVIGFLGIIICLYFRSRESIWQLESEKDE
ncbi:MAG: MFS transporter [Oscillospiraceae bacterium]|nr:MFS transporter [Oscillospiraceae bacterium]